jgi:hypothetical protein
MAVGTLWARIRSIPLEQTTRMVDDLARRQESIEALLVRLEKTRSHDAKASTSRLSVASSGAEPAAGPVQRTDRGKASAVGRPTLIVVPNLATTTPDASSAAAAAAELSQRFGAIWALADSGLSSDAIARETGQPIGQVELILGLRQLTSQAAEPA